MDSTLYGQYLDLMLCIACFVRISKTKQAGNADICTVTSPNIARPLTLRTSPSGYATFNQIKSLLLFDIGLLFEREKQQKVFTLYFHC